MIDMLRELCGLDGVSGREEKVRDFILSQIKPYAECRVDSLGNIIALKKGRRKAAKKLMLASHMDEVGLIVHTITDDGFLKFTSVGGIDPRVVIGQAVRVGEKQIKGVVGSKPIHLLEDEERKTAPDFENMYIDIGAENKEQAGKYASIGDVAAFDSDMVSFGDGFLKSKALDDRAGCAILIELIRQDFEYDTYFVFTVQEEVGLRGAKAAAFSVSPDAAIVIETTTAADISGVEKEKQVCRLGEGAVVSFMDGRTIYDKNFYDAAFKLAAENRIKCQPKAAVAGGNDAGAIHQSKAGVRTIAVSLACRYLHSPSCVINTADIKDSEALVKVLAKNISAGNI